MLVAAGETRSPAKAALDGIPAGAHENAPSRQQHTRIVGTSVVVLPPKVFAPQSAARNLRRWACSLHQPGLGQSWAELLMAPMMMQTKVFGRLAAWQNWIFTRPNASGPDGALRRFGTGRKGDFNFERV
jgi:hypothetical protein